MGMKIADMESHQKAYQGFISKAQLALGEGIFREAVDLAFSALEHAEGLLQYHRKYGQRGSSLAEGLAIVLNYAPFVFNFEILDHLESFTKNRRLGKHLPDGWAARLSDARTLMWDAHRLWNELEKQGEMEQRALWQTLAGSPERWEWIALTWERMGVLHRTPEGPSFRLAFATRMDGLFLARCPSCGAVVRGPKVKFLERVTCPKCSVRGLLVLLSRAPGQSK